MLVTQFDIKIYHRRCSNNAVFSRGQTHRLLWISEGERRTIVNFRITDHPSAAIHVMRFLTFIIRYSALNSSDRSACPLL